MIQNVQNNHSDHDTSGACVQIFFFFFLNKGNMYIFLKSILFQKSQVRARKGSRRGKSMSTFTEKTNMTKVGVETYS